MSGAKAIYGVGLCCSLGRNFADTVKAYRDGERNFVRSDKVIGPDGMPLRTAPVFPLPELQNFELRLKRLFEAAMEDLLAQIGTPQDRVPLRLVVPAWLIGNPIGERLSDWILETWRPVLSNVEQVSSETETVLGELAFAPRMAGDAMIVGALDSFLHAELLDLLALDDRLLTRRQPHGMIPSEAAVLFYLAGPRGSDEQPPLGHVVAAWRGREEEDIRKPKGMVGRSLATGFSAALDVAMPGRLLIDLNGERWRSEELGFVLSAAPPLPHGLEADFETPTLHAGFCGIATPALMAALALASPPPAHGEATDDGAEGEGAPDIALVSTSQFNGPRAVLLIRRFPAIEPIHEEETISEQVA